MATPIPTNRARFTLPEVFAATGGSLRGPLEDAALEVAGVATDSRTLEPGQAFVALAGERFDGHAHLAAAAERGASLAIVERDVEVRGLTVLRVESTLAALAGLAEARVARWRADHGGRVVALTGSAGKTTTKRALAALAEARLPHRVTATQGNLNNLVGVPMTMLALSDDARLLVLEMGTNAPGEIGKLARMARPDLALVTLIASAHSEGLGGLDGIAREKTAMFRGLARGAVALGNADDARVRAGLAACVASDKIGYGTAADADYRILRREALDLERSRLEVRRPDGSTLSFTTPLLGAAGALATTAALAAIEAAFPGRPFHGDEAEAALAHLGVEDAGPGRLAPRRLTSGVVVVDDSYNANPASTEASIEAARELARVAGRRLVLVLGDMLELGEDRDASHESLGDWAARSGARLLLTVGDHSARGAALARARGLDARHAETSERAAEFACELVRADDLVLVKGSRGVRTERVVAALARCEAAPRAEQEGAGR
ncbi:MAG: UDP-N-acetylmuramoyl-tripeptide--D-alanyl-D-alanine ligase [Deltaproteobacteria bacterium]|nr:UDP-N-acetylmuramoyl-tripeptide--D-alanyl-D-alanine ligase [Deltaproteobacteria bacterium]